MSIVPKVGSVAGSLLALAGSIWWYAGSPDREPAVAILTTSLAVIGSGYWLVHHLLYSEERLRRLEAQKADFKNRCDVAAARIRKERGNLERCLEKKPYSGSAHQKAVEVDSLELLEKAIVPLKEVTGVSRKVAPITAEIERVRGMPKGEKNTSDLLTLLDDLESTVEQQLAKLR